MIIHFGKHKGKSISELPDGYLEWLVEDSFIYLKHKRLYSMCCAERKSRLDTPEISNAEIAASRCKRYTEYIVEQIIEKIYEEPEFRP